MHQPLNQTRAGDVRIPCVNVSSPLHCSQSIVFSWNSITSRKTRNTLVFPWLMTFNVSITHNPRAVPTGKKVSVELEDGGVNRPSVENDRVTWDSGSPATSLWCVLCIFFFLLNLHFLFIFLPNLVTKNPTQWCRKRLIR